MIDNSILISIKPQYCGLIALGEKTAEVRKSRPKFRPPFKCYIYCTTVKRMKISDYVHLHAMIGSAIDDWSGRVMGEFVCDDITPVQFFFGGIKEDLETELAGSCLTNDGARRYFLTKKNKEKDPFLYNWHITNLVIYETPRLLGELCKPCKGADDSGLCLECNYYDGEECLTGAEMPLAHPPQSWCYISPSAHKASDETLVRGLCCDCKHTGLAGCCDFRENLTCSHKMPDGSCWTALNS